MGGKYQLTKWNETLSVHEMWWEPFLRWDTYFPQEGLFKIRVHLHYEVINYKQSSGRRSLICPDLFLSITVYRNGKTKRNSKTFLPVRSPKTLNNFATRWRFSTPPLSVIQTGNYFLWVMWEYKAISFIITSSIALGTASCTWRAVWQPPPMFQFTMSRGPRVHWSYCEV